MIPERDIVKSQAVEDSQSASIGRLREWSQQYPTFEQWNDPQLNTPGRLITRRAKQAARRYQDDPWTPDSQVTGHGPQNFVVMAVPVESVKPSQKEKDYLNDGGAIFIL